MVISRSSFLTRLPHRLWTVYSLKNRTHPLSTKASTSCFLVGTGDIFSQSFEGNHKLDVMRTSRMASWGFIVAPVGHGWYWLLDELVKIGGVRGLGLKLLLDQGVFTPPLTVVYFMYQHILRGDSFQESFAAVRRQLMPTLKVNWCYWSAAHVITFTLIPLEYRVLFVSFKNFLWAGFLSYITNHKRETK